MTIIYKCNGLGNGFFVVDAYEGNPISLDEQKQKAIEWCDQQRGLSKEGYVVGANGLIFIEKPSFGVNADMKMRLYNADGSVPEMCGNGIRCLAYVAIKNNIKKWPFSVETIAGVMKIDGAVMANNNEAFSCTVDMGKPELGRVYPVCMSDITIFVKSVSMGNPHGVVFLEKQISEYELLKYGPLLEKKSFFLEGANIEFSCVKSRSYVDVKVWERGVGATKACGTGACAVVAAGIKANLLDKLVSVELPGGVLKIEWPQEDGSIYMTGAVEEDYQIEMPQ